MYDCKWFSSSVRHLDHDSELKWLQNPALDVGFDVEGDPLSGIPQRIHLDLPSAHRLALLRFPGIHRQMTKLVKEHPSGVESRRRRSTDEDVDRRVYDLLMRHLRLELETEDVGCVSCHPQWR